MSEFIFLVAGIIIGIVASYFYVRNNKKKVETIIKAEKDLKG